MSSSLDAQRLLLWIGREGGGARRREAFFERIARAHFRERRAYDRAMLLEAAAAVGVDAGRAARFLDSGRDEAAVRQAFLRVMYAWGYASIPVTLFSCEGAHFQIQGSSALADYVEVLRRCAALPNTTYPSARASWEDMEAKADPAAATWRDLEHRVFSSPDCGGLLKATDR